MTYTLALEFKRQLANQGDDLAIKFSQPINRFVDGNRFAHEIHNPILPAIVQQLLFCALKEYNRPQPANGPEVWPK
ncbi:hypothetical protein GC197_05495 [bacterium]|nr:hypothetical protein [bacterium]